MRTGGYDLVLETNERFVNKLLLAAYCMGKFPKSKSGSYTLPIPNVPASLVEFITVDYDLEFKVPTIDFISKDATKILLSAETYLTVLGGIELKLDVLFSIETSVTYDQTTRQLSIDFDHPNVDIEINDARFPQNVLDKLNEILSIAIDEYLTEDVSTISISPVLYALSLPHTSNELTIGLGNIKTTNDIAAVSFNFLGYNGGSIHDVADFTGGSDFSAGISESAMHQVFDFWWKHTTYPKSIAKAESQSLDTSEYDFWFDWILTTIAVLFPGLGTIISAVASQMIDIDELRVEYGGKINFGKPELDLLNGNKIRVSGKVRADISVGLFVKIVINYLFGSDTYNKNIGSFSVRNMSINYSALGTVYLDNQNRLMADIEDMDISLGVMEWLMGAPAFLIELVLKWLADKMVDELPPIVLSSSLVSLDIPGTQLSLGIDSAKLEGTDDEAIVNATLRIKGLENYCSPLYIANRNRACLEVHKRDCAWVGKMLEKHKVPYFFLDEARKDGYDNCHYCLGGSER
ncbi:MAG: hypothetical protein PHD13_01350 [Methanocellales archaeon]|nr:hypothetical protein [Methanocellales archaeon]MDD3290924.1 hypothetical protein [Methanocellales archaeon]MDD3292332.1 hypothetical protein [Methanocellales archaeon]MDD5234809.1 hypothetical protein [Methanocellales archaeon]MDD5484821.1 hypothetical protein [Methanocellales archaeon]